MPDVHVYKTIRTRMLMSSSEIVSIVQRVVKQEKSFATQVNVHIVGRTRIQTLNRMYRGISAPTDVLSFDAGEHWGGEEQELGDIFICQTYIIAQAARFSVTAKEEMIRMLVHGTLHLLGYDHEKQKDSIQMFARQESYVTKFMKRK